MRILQVLPSIASETGGPVHSTLANCRAVHAVDPSIRFTLATTDQALGAEWGKEFETRMPPQMELVVLRAVGHRAFIFSPSLMTWLWRHVRNFNLVVVRTLFNPISSTAAWIARYRDVPYLVVPHGTVSPYTFQHRRTLLKKTYFWLVERRTLAGAAAIRFTSEAERREAPFWRNEPCTFVIPHPYKSTFEGADLRERNPSQILFLSRLHPKKGIDVLLEAFRRVRTEVPAARLVMAGSGTPTYERHVRAEIQRLDLGDSVELPGFVMGNQKTALFHESAVFVLPSHQENFGIAVVEAMDAGLPVVISRGVDIWPQVEEAEAGIVVEERTPGVVANALLTLLEDEALRGEAAQNGQELIQTAFAPRKVGRRLRNLYRTAASRQTEGLP